MKRAKILDLSHHQNNPPLDLARAAAEDDINGVIIRCAHGITPDEMFYPYWMEAGRLGLHRGIYFFPEADQPIDAQIELVLTYPLADADLPVALDIERDPYRDAQMNEGLARRWLESIARETAKLPAIYTNKYFWESLIGKGKTWAGRYPLWVANPSADLSGIPTLPDVWSSWVLWQHAVAPLVSYPGRNVDQNVFNGTLDDLCCQFGDPYREWEFAWPTDDAFVTQPFGVNPAHYGPLLQVGGTNVQCGHEGVDIRAPMGAAIYAAQQGIVRAVFTSESYGINVRLDHCNGLVSIYAHLQQSLVTVGQRVTRGQVIAKADNTGASTGAHLHFAVQRKNASVMGWTSYPSDFVDSTRWMVAPQVQGVMMRNQSSLILNIRAQPNVTSADIGDIPTGAIVKAWPQSGAEYIKIEYEGITGYALQKHFEPVSTPTPVRLRSTADPYVNIRSGPATSYTDIGNLNFGDEIMGYPVQGDSFWRVIMPNGSDGWISAQWLQVV